MKHKIIPIFLVLFLVLCFLKTEVYAKSYIISPLPLPQQEVLNVSTDKCSNSCLSDLFVKGQFFSFIAFFSNQARDTELRAKLSSILGDLGIFDQIIGPEKNSNVRIKLALLMPKKIIGRYSVTSIDTILAYLMARGNDFVFEVFDTGDESVGAIKNTYNKIAQSNYDFVVAIFTLNGAQELANLSINIPTYLPTINKRQLKNPPSNKNLYFGGIDYEAQIDVLLSLAGDKPIVAYNDNSFVGRNLGNILKSKTSKLVYEEVIDSQAATTFVQRLRIHERSIAGNNVFFNTPVVKTGLMASQLALSKKLPDKLLSTQINFNPSLLLLIQREDRKNLYITNVISNKNQYLVEYASLLGGDLRYDWVNYSTAIGVEQLISSHIAENHRFFQERLKDGQVEYINKIYKSDAKKFYEYR